MTEDERRAIVESGVVYFWNGLRAHLGGWKNPNYCTLTSAKPGFYATTWETIREVTQRPDRRFGPLDTLWLESRAWLGSRPRKEDYQTEADYERAKALGDVD